MYFFVAVACLGVYLTSSSSSVTVMQDITPGVKLNESMKEQEQKEKVVIDQYAMTDMESNTKRIIHSKHEMGPDEQEEDFTVKPGSFSIESFLNLFNMAIGKNVPSPLGGKDNQTSVSKIEEINEGDHVIDDVDIEMQEENKSESQESESNGQQSLGLSYDGLLEKSENFPLKTNTENGQDVTESSTVYTNILERTDDETLQNTLTITHNLDSMKEMINNDTQEDVEEPSPGDMMDIKEEEGATNMTQTYVNDSEMSREEEDLIKEENGVKTRNISRDPITEQKKSATEEQDNQQSHSIVNYNRKRGDVPDVENSSDMTSADRNDGNADTASTDLLQNSSKPLGIDAAKGGRLEINVMNLSADPCINFHCKRGKICKTDGHGNPFCDCQDPDLCLPGNRNDLVCGTDNKTYASVCHLFGNKCLLEGTKEGNHLHLDYQGPCKYIPPCTEYELAHFPFRMRDWLKNVLIQLYERDQENTGLLSEKQKNKVKKIYENERRLQEGDHDIELLVKDFQKNYHMYIYPVHWQFYQLDQHVKDRMLTHSELAALRAPLIPIEHCVNTFLQKCNTNNDRHISLWEWCHCFGIKEDDVDEDLLF
ncbi:SPARC-like protein 1 [Dendropsophus ebraccatus]|uniref:SPARC-like protein 1 n=1 Tax=Dendropsophus ebraccatus TaxID=150705 RepID=UPI0038318032